MALKTTIDSVAPTLVSDQIKVGDEGVTLSRLNPMGSVLINDVTVEARHEKILSMRILRLSLKK